MFENLFNKNKSNNITKKINNIDDFKYYILKSKDDNKYYYIIIDDVKYIIGLFLNFLFEKIEITNIYMIIINKGLLYVIKKFNISNEFNVKMFEDFFKSDVNNNLTHNKALL